MEQNGPPPFSTSLQHIPPSHTPLCRTTTTPTQLHHHSGKEREKDHCCRPTRMVHHGGPPAPPQPRLTGRSIMFSPTKRRRRHAQDRAVGKLRTRRRSMAPDAEGTRRKLQGHAAHHQICKTSRLAQEPYSHRHPPPQLPLGDAIPLLWKHPR